MSRERIIKLLGLLGACATGAVSIANGDIMTGGGIILAALSSPSAFSKPSQ